jgi:hypothetical protein
MAELSPLVPLPLLPSEVVVDLASFHQHFLSGTLYASFKRANPGEASRLETYWSNAGAWPAVVTQTGLALRDAYHAYHRAGG